MLSDMYSSTLITYKRTIFIMRPHPYRYRKGLRAMFSPYERSRVNSLEHVVTEHFHYSLTKENIKACYKICITKFYLKQSINITLYSNIPQLFSDFHHTWTKNKQNNFFFTQFFLRRVDRQGHCSHEAIQQKLKVTQSGNFFFILPTKEMQ